MEKSKIREFAELFGAILLCEAAGGIGTYFTVPSIESWYKFLTKPSFAPPNWLFGPVWTLLYALMGISLYLVWQKGFASPASKFALGVFFVQLLLNSLWSVIFFGMKNMQFAFFEILGLWVFILITIMIFYKISKPAGLLLVPYILWVSFAGFLNYAYWQINT